MNMISRPGAHPTRGRMLRFVIDHNPFYLLSALCMLGGLLTLTNSLSYNPIPQRHLLLLIATLNAYELLLVGLAIWLIVNRKLVRDGGILLGVEALFLADTAMLNAELFTLDRRLGAIVNLLLLLLAAGKLALVFRALQIRSRSAYLFILANLFLLFALPGVFKQIAMNDNGKLTALAVYAAWWAVGLLPIGFALVFRRPELTAIASNDRRPKAHMRIVMRFVLFAFASTLIHLRLLNWVYQVQWEWANLTPLFLGLAICIGMLDGHVHTLAMRMRTQLAMPLVAIAFSLRFSPDLIVALGPIGLSPLRFAFAGATAVYLHGLWLHRHVYFAMASAICFASIGLGASPGMAAQNLTAVWNGLVAIVRRVYPRTTSDWGVLSVITSFVLLVLGAGVSILRGSPRHDGDPSASETPYVPPSPPAHV